MSRKFSAFLAALCAGLLLAFPAQAEEAPESEVAGWVRTGKAYFHGEQRFIRQDYEKAHEFFEKAANHDDPVALYYMGNLYHEGLGVDQDEEKAREFYLRAAEKGQADAQMITGVGHIMDGIILRDEEAQEAKYVIAVDWLKKAAAQKQPEALFWLGDMTLKGLGTEENEAKGLAMIREASDKGNPNAMAMLGAFHWRGMYGFEKDLLKAHALMVQSELKGNEQAETLREALENDMSKEQRGKARLALRKAREAQEAPRKP